MNKDYYKILKEHSKSNKSYQQGVAFERRIVAFFRKNGWFAKRNWGSQGTRIKGKSFKDDGFACKKGIVWTAKWSKNHATRPENYSEDVEATKALAHMFGLIPVFAGVDDRRRIYLLNLDTGEKINLAELD